MRCDADEDVGDADDYVGADVGDVGDEDHLDPPLDSPLPVQPAPLSFYASCVIFHVALPNCCLALFSLALVIDIVIIFDLAFLLYNYRSNLLHYQH